MISIIVPIYRVEQFLPKCIDSLLAQTYQDFELILVEDGSPDGCAAICDQYKQKDPRIVVIHQPNGGVSAARNAGLAIARGEYIGFVDPDDWVAPEMYGEMLSAIERTQADLAICGYDYCSEDGVLDTARRYHVRAPELLSQKELMNRFADMPPTVRHGVVNKLFRTQMLSSIRFLSGLHSSEDVLFLLEYSLRITQAVMVHQPYYKSCVRQGSATHGGLKLDSLADSFMAHDQMYQATISRYPELKNHALAFLMDVCALKYNEAKTRLSSMPKDQQPNAQKRLGEMKHYIRKHAWRAAFDSEIFWKTRIYYFLL